MEPTTNIDEMQRTLEAVLFAAGHPLTYEKLASLFSVTPKEAKKLVTAYADLYNSETCPRGVMLLVFEDSCQLCTKEQYAPVIRETLGIRRGGNLSNASLETLAIIAYNQPVTRAYIDTVRGVDSSYALSSLIERTLVAPCGRLDAPGRPMLYGTTESFLRCFGLRSLADLPPINQEALRAFKNLASAALETGAEDGLVSPDDT